MKELILNHGINANVIITDIAPYLSILLLVICCVIYSEAKKTNQESQRLSGELAVSNAKLEERSVENFALSFNNDQIKSENNVLKYANYLLEKKLEKYNFKRDAKGHFISKDPKKNIVANEKGI